MNRRGITLLETLIAIAVFTVLISLVLRMFFLGDRAMMRSEAGLKATLGRVALQSQLRNDIWMATQFQSAADDMATFIMPDGTVAIYAPAAGGKVSRTCSGEETLYKGTLVFSEGKHGLIAVLGQDTAEWGFAARMRNKARERR